MNKFLIASDYDGTFYLSDEGIKVNKEYVEKFREEGNIFVIATGRSYMDFKNKVNQYDIVYDYAILNHGATIIDTEDNIIYNELIDNNAMKSIKHLLRMEDMKDYFCCSTFLSRVDIDHLDLTKIRIDYYNKCIAKRVSDDLNTLYKDYVNCYYIRSTALEIISNKTNKSHAIELLGNLLNISHDNTITIGDGHSDLPMIEDYNGYRMKECVEELKSVTSNEVASVSDLIKLTLKRK